MGKLLTESGRITALKPTVLPLLRRGKTTSEFEC